MRDTTKKIGLMALLVMVVIILGMASAPASKDKPPATPSSYSPVVITEDFATIFNRMKAAKPEIMKRQMDLLQMRYDLGNRPAKGVTMSRGKAVQEGVRVKLPKDLGQAGGHEPGRD